MFILLSYVYFLQPDFGWMDQTRGFFGVNLSEWFQVGALRVFTCPNHTSSTAFAMSDTRCIREAVGADEQPVFG